MWYIIDIFVSLRTTLRILHVYLYNSKPIVSISRQLTNSVSRLNIINPNSERIVPYTVKTRQGNGLVKVSFIHHNINLYIYISRYRPLFQISKLQIFQFLYGTVRDDALPLSCVGSIADTAKIMLRTRRMITRDEAWNIRHCWSTARAKVVHGLDLNSDFSRVKPLKLHPVHWSTMGILYKYDNSCNLIAVIFMSGWTKCHGADTKR